MNSEKLRGQFFADSLHYVHLSNITIGRLVTFDNKIYFLDYFNLLIRHFRKASISSFETRDFHDDPSASITPFNRSVFIVYLIPREQKAWHSILFPTGMEMMLVKKLRNSLQIFTLRVSYRAINTALYTLQLGISIEAMLLLSNQLCPKDFWKLSQRIWHLWWNVGIADGNMSRAWDTLQLMRQEADIPSQPVPVTRLICSRVKLVVQIAFQRLFPRSLVSIILTSKVWNLHSCILGLWFWKNSRTSEFQYAYGSWRT